MGAPMCHSSKFNQSICKNYLHCSSPTSMSNCACIVTLKWRFLNCAVCLWCEMIVSFCTYFLCQYEQYCVRVIIFCLLVTWGAAFSYFIQHSTAGALLTCKVTSSVAVLALVVSVLLLPMLFVVESWRCTKKLTTKLCWISVSIAVTSIIQHLNCFSRGFPSTSLLVLCVLTESRCIHIDCVLACWQ